MKTLFIFMAEGFEEVEALTTVDILRRAGLDVKMASIDDREYVSGAHGIVIRSDLGISDVDIKEAEMLILPGGAPGWQNLQRSEKLSGLILDFNKAGGRIAAICGAPVVLGGLDILKDKKATCYPGMEDALKGAKATCDEAVTDGNITTSRGVGTAIPFALEIVRLLLGDEKAGMIKKSIVYMH